jgi:hypothetical protein
MAPQDRKDHQDFKALQDQQVQLVFQVLKDLKDLQVQMGLKDLQVSKDLLVY